VTWFVTWISFRGTFQSFWDLIEVSAQSLYKVRTDLVTPTFKISLLGVIKTMCIFKEPVRMEDIHKYVYIYMFVYMYIHMFIYICTYIYI